jgi:hypothetical protein
MTSRTTRRFREALAGLPENVRKRAAAAYRQFRDDPRHPGLRLKKVHPSEPIYSARISDDYRAVGVLRGETIVWFWIGKHEDYEELLKRL